MVCAESNLIYSKEKEKMLKGIAASSGVAIGKAYKLEHKSTF